jgi:hypothetical protein
VLWLSAGIVSFCLRASAQPSPQLLTALKPPYGEFVPLQPVAVAISPEFRIYILDAQLAAVAQLDTFGNLINQIGGPGMSGSKLNDPADLCINSGLNLFIADRGNDRILRLDRKLNFLAEFRSLEGTPVSLTFEAPRSVLQGARGDLFIADGGNDRILKIDPNNIPLFSFGAYGEEKGSLLQPRRIESDPSGGIWVLDRRAHVVHFDEFGGFLEELLPKLAGRASGLAVSAGVVWVCADSCLWIYDRLERRSNCVARDDLVPQISSDLVDLAYRQNQLWVLDAQGCLYRFRVSGE